LIKTDNETEFNNNIFKSFCSTYGIQHQLTVPYNPQHNGRVEKLNGTLTYSSKAILNDSKQSHRFWEDAAFTSNYIHNIPHKGIHSKIPYEVLTKPKVDYSNIHVFGCKVFSSSLNNFEVNLIIHYQEYFLVIMIIHPHIKF